MRPWCSLLVLLLATHFGHAQLSIDKFLFSAAEDPKVKGLREQVRYLNGKPYRLSPLQRFELRSQIREMDPAMQEYGLRVTPANPWEVRNSNRYYKAFASSLSLESEIILKEALQERYYAVVNYIYLKQMLGLLANQEKLIDDQISILEKQSGSSYFDADEYLDLNVDQLDVMVEKEEIEFELMMAAGEIDRLGRTKSSGLYWEVSQVITPARMKMVVDSLIATTLRNISVEYQQQQIDLAASEYKLEKSNINIGFLQTDYDKRRVAEDRTPYNISLGITIPITNPNKGDMARRKLELIEAQYELEGAKNDQMSGTPIQHEKLLRLLKRHEELTARMQTLQNSTLAGTLSSLKGGDPRFVIRYQENQVKLSVMLAKLQRDMLYAYVDYLAFLDKLQQQPLINFFSPELKGIR
jgi:hypothetical protein